MKNKIAIACVISAVAACVICFIVLCVPVIPSNESNMRVRDVYCMNEDGVQKVYINYRIKVSCLMGSGVLGKAMR